MRLTLATRRNECHPEAAPGVGAAAGPRQKAQFCCRSLGAQAVMCWPSWVCNGSSGRARCSLSACPAEERLLWFSTVHKDWDFSNGSTANPVCATTNPNPPLPPHTPPTIHSTFTRGQAVPQILSQAVRAQGLSSRRHLDAMLSTSASATPASESCLSLAYLPLRQSPMLGCTYTG